MNDRDDPAYGVKAFSIAGRMIHERERLKGMTDVERQWRAQWVKDQHLSPDEPRHVPELYKATNNIFRRMYKEPLAAFQRMLEPLVGRHPANLARQTLGKGLIMLYTAWFSYYMYKYSWNDWTKAKTVEVYVGSSIMYPDEPNYPNYPKSEHYYDLGFNSSVLAKPKTENSK